MSRAGGESGCEWEERVSNAKGGGELLTCALLEASENCFSNVVCPLLASLSGAVEVARTTDPLARDLLEVALVVGLPTLALDVPGVGCILGETSAPVLLHEME